MEEGAFAPLHHRFWIKVVAAGELLDRSLRSLYNSSDGACTWRCGKKICPIGLPEWRISTADSMTAQLDVQKNTPQI
jgi:hypothetical protein